MASFRPGAPGHGSTAGSVSISAFVKDQSLAYVERMLAVTARGGVYYSSDVQSTLAIPSHLDATKVCSRVIHALKREPNVVATETSEGNWRFEGPHTSLDRPIVTADSVKTLYDAILLEHSVSVSLLVRNSAKYPLSNLRNRLHKTGYLSTDAIAPAIDIIIDTVLRHDTSIRLINNDMLISTDKTEGEHKDDDDDELPTERDALVAVLAHRLARKAIYSRRSVGLVEQQLLVHKLPDTGMRRRVVQRLQAIGCFLFVGDNDATAIVTLDQDCLYRPIHAFGDLSFLRRTCATWPAVTNGVAKVASRPPSVAVPMSISTTPKSTSSSSSSAAALTSDQVHAAVEAYIFAAQQWLDSHAEACPSAHVYSWKVGLTFPVPLSIMKSVVVPALVTDPRLRYRPSYLTLYCFGPQSDAISDDAPATLDDVMDQVVPHFRTRMLAMTRKGDVYGAADVIGSLRVPSHLNKDSAVNCVLDALARHPDVTWRAGDSLSHSGFVASDSHVKLPTPTTPLVVPPVVASQWVITPSSLSSPSSPSPPRPTSSLTVDTRPRTLYDALLIEHSVRVVELVHAASGHAYLLQHVASRLARTSYIPPASAQDALETVVSMVLRLDPSLRVLESADGPCLALGVAPSRVVGDTDASLPSELNAVMDVVARRFARRIAYAPMRLVSMATQLTQWGVTNVSDVLVGVQARLQSVGCFVSAVVGPDVVTAIDNACLLRPASEFGTLVFLRREPRFASPSDVKSPATKPPPGMVVSPAKPMVDASLPPALASRSLLDLLLEWHAITLGDALHALGEPLAISRVHRHLERTGYITSDLLPRAISVVLAQFASDASLGMEGDGDDMVVVPMGERRHWTTPRSTPFDGPSMVQATVIEFIELIVKAPLDYVAMARIVKEKPRFGYSTSKTMKLVQQALFETDCFQVLKTGEKALVTIAPWALPRKASMLVKHALLAHLLARWFSPPPPPNGDRPSDAASSIDRRTEPTSTVVIDRWAVDGPTTDATALEAYVAASLAWLEAHDEACGEAVIYDLKLEYPVLPGVIKTQILPALKRDPRLQSRPSYVAGFCFGPRNNVDSNAPLLTQVLAQVLPHIKRSMLATIEKGRPFHESDVRGLLRPPATLSLDVVVQHVLGALQQEPNVRFTLKSDTGRLVFFSRNDDDDDDNDDDDDDDDEDDEDDDDSDGDDEDDADEDEENEVDDVVNAADRVSVTSITESSATVDDASMWNIRAIEALVSPKSESASDDAIVSLHHETFLASILASVASGSVFYVSSLSSQVRALVNDDSAATMAVDAILASLRLHPQLRYCDDDDRRPCFVAATPPPATIDPETVQKHVAALSQRMEHALRTAMRFDVGFVPGVGDYNSSELARLVVAEVAKDPRFELRATDERQPYFETSRAHLCKPPSPPRKPEPQARTTVIPLEPVGFTPPVPTNVDDAPRPALPAKVELHGHVAVVKTAVQLRDVVAAHAILREPWLPGRIALAVHGNGSALLLAMAWGTEALIVDCESTRVDVVATLLQPMLLSPSVCKVIYGSHTQAGALVRLANSPIASLIDLELLFEHQTSRFNVSFAEMLSVVGLPAHPHPRYLDRPDFLNHRPLLPEATQAAAATVQLLLQASDVLAKAIFDNISPLMSAANQRLHQAIASDGQRSLCFDAQHNQRLVSTEYLQAWRPHDVVSSPPVVIHEDLDDVLGLLPPDLAAPLLQPDVSAKLLDIVLDLGRRPWAWVNGARFFLDTANQDRVVTRDDLDSIVDRVGGFGSDNRAGLERQLHRISAIRNRQDNIIALTIRVGRYIEGNAGLIADLLAKEDKNILFLGEPGCGKTTIVREVSRQLATKYNVCIVDTSNEIAGDGDIPHPCVGLARRMMVPSLNDQAAVMVECVQNHTPEVMVIDEIGRPNEVEAARTCKQRGVRIVASAHGDLRKLLKNKPLRGLVGGVESVTVGDALAKEKQKKDDNGPLRKLLAQRGGEPIFEVIVELRRGQYNAWRIVTDAASAVDAILAGEAYEAQVRTRAPYGGVGFGFGVESI